MILNIWKCSGTCNRQLEATQEETAGRMLVLCKECKAVMKIERSFYRCDKCGKEADCEPEGWYRFSYGAHFLAKGNWTPGVCKCVHFCSTDCESAWYTSEIDFIQRASHRSFDNPFEQQRSAL